MLEEADRYTEQTNGKEFLIHDAESFIDSNTRGMMMPLRSILTRNSHPSLGSPSPVAVACTDVPSARRASAVIFATSKMLVPHDIQNREDIASENDNHRKALEKPYEHVICVAGMKIKSQIQGKLHVAQCLERLDIYLKCQVRAFRFGVRYDQKV